MARTFDGVDDRITLSPGAAAIAFGTVAMLVNKQGTDSSQRTFMGTGAGGTSLYALRCDASNRLTLTGPGGTLGSFSPSITVLASQGWQLIVATKATGSVAPRYHRYLFDTQVWTRDNGAALANFTTAGITTLTVGANEDFLEWMAMECAAVGVWDRVLTDDQVTSLAHSLAAWFAVQPKFLCLLDQATVAQLVNDLSGGGALQTAIVGTAVSPESVPSFSYGMPAR